MCICVSFLVKVFFSGEISVVIKLVVAPNDELVYEITVGYMLLQFFSVFFPILLKKSSVSNQ